MTSATIKLFLPRGDAKGLRTAELSNWTGKVVAAPRTALEEFFSREELEVLPVTLSAQWTNERLARANREIELLRQKKSYLGQECV